MARDSGVPADPESRSPEDLTRESSPPLRVGFLLNSTLQPRWVEHAIQLVADASFAQVAAILLPESIQDQDRRAQQSLFRLYVELDRKLFRRQPDPLAHSSVDPLLTGVPVIRLSQTPSISQTERDSIRTAELDVIICFGSIEAGRQLTAEARYGIWYFPDVGLSPGAVRPVGYDATVRDGAVVETSLNELTVDAVPGRTLYRAVSAANSYSPHYTERRLLWKMATYPVRALNNLITSNHLADLEDEVDQAGSAAHAAPAEPNTLRTLEVAARLGFRQVRHAARTSLFRSEWSIAFRRDDVLNLDTLLRPNPPGTYTFIESPPDRFWADPFPVSDGEGQWLFVEEFPHRANRAHLSVMRLSADGTVGPSTPVLECPYHLSYPHVFQWKDDWYMVPETLENHAVDLYRSMQFPYKWTHVQRLLDGVDAVDATLAEIDGRWWMFTTIASYGGSENDELHIFHADSPMGPWSPITGNPWTSDVRQSRPAGRVFSLDGAWYRPAQDCSRRYGYAMTMNRITALSESHFREEVVARIDPTWATGLLGTHTFNHSEGITLLDGDRWRRRFKFGAKDQV
jgi:hypothetical protein